MHPEMLSKIVLFTINVLLYNQFWQRGGEFRLFIYNFFIYITYDCAVDAAMSKKTVKFSLNCI